MKRTTPILLTSLALGLGAASTAQGQQSTGYVNDWVRQQTPEAKDWDIGGQFRLRFENREHMAIAGVPGAVDFRETSPDTENTYWLFRTKLHIGYKPCTWISGYVEGRDSFSYNDDRVPNSESDRIDLHQAYLTIGNPKAFPITAKLGRQELIYGDERLVGASDWGNLGRVFDAAKVRYEVEDIWAEGFASRLVIPDDNNFNMSNEYETFSGVYAGSKTLVQGQETHLYFLARNASAKSPTLQTGNLIALATPRDVYTVGTRWKSLPKAYGNWDYTLEGAYQFGRYKETAAGPSLDQDAYAATMNVGYTFKRLVGSPRVAAEFNYATGDSNARDDKHGTFDNLFPTNHRFYGAMDLFSWQNMQNARLNVSAKPHKDVTVAFDANGFWLQDDRDYFYQVTGSARSAGGYGRFSQAGKYAGTELDLVITYAPDPNMNFMVGIGHFFVGDYAKDSFAVSGVGGTHDADWAFAQFRLNF
jgi:hypothetical protein